MTSAEGHPRKFLNTGCCILCSLIWHISLYLDIHWLSHVSNAAVLHRSGWWFVIIGTSYTSLQHKFLNTRNFLSVFYVRYVARQDRVTELTGGEYPWKQKANGQLQKTCWPPS